MRLTVVNMSQFDTTTGYTASRDCNFWGTGHVRVKMRCYCTIALKHSVHWTLPRICLCKSNQIKSNMDF